MYEGGCVLSECLDGTEMERGADTMEEILRTNCRCWQNTAILCHTSSPSKELKTIK